MDCSVSQQYELHPLCSLFPRMQGAEFSALVEDIRAVGLREPIILHEGLILDGGNRYRACLEAGVEPQFMKFGGGNLVSYVLSANLHRRHMTPGQQAAIVASAQDWAQAQTVGRPKNGSDYPISTTEDRAAMSGASVPTQKLADRVAKTDPGLAKQVAQGEISLPKAVEQITGKRPGAKPVTSVQEPSDPVPVPATPAPSEPTPAASETDELREQLDEARSMLRDLADELAILSDIKAGDEAKRLMKLQAENRALKSQLDDYINQNAQLKRQVKMMQRQLGSTARA